MLRLLIGLSCTLALVCGGAILGIGIWNAVAIQMSGFAIALFVWGGVVCGLSLIGFVAVSGCDCGKCLMMLFSVSMLAVGMAEAIFVIIAGVKKSTWVTTLAEKYASPDDQASIDWAEEQYTKYWWAFVAFMATAAAASLSAAIFGLWYTCRDSEELVEARRKNAAASKSRTSRKWSQFMVSKDSTEARKALTQTISEGQRLQNERKAVLDEIKHKYSTNNNV